MVQQKLPAAIFLEMAVPAGKSLLRPLDATASLDNRAHIDQLNSDSDGDRRSVRGPWKPARIRSVACAVLLEGESY
jgi:hypothetical protein